MRVTFNPDFFDGNDTADVDGTGLLFQVGPHYSKALDTSLLRRAPPWPEAPNSLVFQEAGMEDICKILAVLRELGIDLDTVESVHIQGIRESESNKEEDIQALILALPRNIHTLEFISSHWIISEDRPGYCSFPVDNLQTLSLLCAVLQNLQFLAIDYMGMAGEDHEGVYNYGDGPLPLSFKSDAEEVSASVYERVRIGIQNLRQMTSLKGVRISNTKFPVDSNIGALANEKAVHVVHCAQYPVETMTTIDSPTTIQRHSQFLTRFGEPDL
jgi:hypothetical protein